MAATVSVVCRGTCRAADTVYLIVIVGSTAGYPTLPNFFKTSKQSKSEIPGTTQQYSLVYPQDRISTLNPQVSITRRHTRRHQALVAVTWYIPHGATRGGMYRPMPLPILARPSFAAGRRELLAHIGCIRYPCCLLHAFGYILNIYEVFVTPGRRVDSGACLCSSNQIKPRALPLSLPIALSSGLRLLL